MLCWPRQSLFLLVVAFLMAWCDAFVVSHSKLILHTRPCSGNENKYGESVLRLVDNVNVDTLPLVYTNAAAAAATSSSMMLMTEEISSWRQYVPLAVSCGVILDILLGSPAANAVLSLARPREDKEAQKDSSSSSFLGPIEAMKRAASGQSLIDNNAKRTRDPKERIDTMAIAQQALDKAAATTELRGFLDESKSDWDKIRDVQRKMDEALADFDDKMASGKNKSKQS